MYVLVLVKNHKTSSTYIHVSCPQVMIIQFRYMRKPWVQVYKVSGRFNPASSTPNQKLSLRSWLERVVRNLMGGRKVSEKKLKCILNRNFYWKGLLPISVLVWYWIKHLLHVVPTKLSLRISFSPTLIIIFLRKTKKFSSQPVSLYYKYWHGLFPYIGDRNV